LNWKTFVAMLQRDGHVARRNLFPMLMQTLLQPLLLTFVFGRVLTASGMMQMGYKNVLLPGIIAIAMVLSGVQAVAMPLIAEFQFTKEIEDRLLAPMENHWLAVEKVVAGMVQSIVSGLVVIPAAWLTMGSGLNVTFCALASGANSAEPVPTLATAAAPAELSRNLRRLKGVSLIEGLLSA